MSSQIAHNLEEKKRTKDVLLDEDVSFQSLLLSDYILQGLIKNGFRKPSPIQLKAIPMGRCGFDIIVQSKSGTGKTLVFAIIALEMVDVKISSLQAIMLAPTREIAVQTQDVLRAIGCEINGLKIESFIGGTPLESDNEKAKNCHIAVGAPGRIRHLIKNGVLDPKYAKLFVLDEADKLLETSFKSDINEIYEALPEQKQMLALSATYSNDLVDFLSNYMLSPTYITADIESPLLLGLRHFVILINNCPNAVLQMKMKNDELQNILTNVRYTQCLIFSNYQTRAESISNFAVKNKWSCGYISAAQTQANRLQAIQDFKKLNLRILSSTDLTARGIDASGVDLVINYDMPPDAMTYLHRMGRAGRYGTEGICINIISKGPELLRFLNILGTIGGTSLSVPVLKTLEIDTDLRKIDLNSLEHLYGTISSKPDVSVEANLKDEVLTIKQTKRNYERKCKRSSKTKNKSKQPAKRLREEPEDTENNKLENIASILDHSKQEVPDSSALSDMDCHSILQSLAEGKTDVLNKIEAPVVKDISVLDSIIEKKSDKLDHREEGTCDKIPDPECKFILQQLAQGKIDGLIGNEEVSTLNYIDTKCDDEALRKRKRGGNETLSSTNSNQDYKRDEQKSHEDDNYCKNVALLSTTKLLFTGPSENVQEEIVGSIGEYLKVLKESDVSTALPGHETSAKNIENRTHTRNQEHVDAQNEENIPDTNINRDLEQQHEDVETTSHLTIPDDLFSIAYESVIKSDAKDWTKFIPKSEMLACEEYHAEEERIRSGKPGSESDEEEEEEIYEDIEEEEEEYEVDYEPYEKKSNKKLKEIDEEAEMAMQPSLEWVPVTKEDSERNKPSASIQGEVLYQAGDIVDDPQTQNEATTDSVEANTNSVEATTDSSDYFTACFQACSDNLWYNGLNFSNVNDFENWFYQWQCQVKDVRDYVQQNIYLDEMNKYRSSRTGK